MPQDDSVVCPTVTNGTAKGWGTTGQKKIEIDPNIGWLEVLTFNASGWMVTDSENVNVLTLM